MPWPYLLLMHKTNTYLQASNCCIEITCKHHCNRFVSSRFPDPKVGRRGHCHYQWEGKDTGISSDWRTIPLQGTAANLWGQILTNLISLVSNYYTSLRQHWYFLPFFVILLILNVEIFLWSWRKVLFVAWLTILWSQETYLANMHFD